MPTHRIRDMPRQTDFKLETAARILELLEGGKSLSAICRMDGMPARSTLKAWREQHPDFAKQVDAARQEGYLTRADEILDIIDDPYLAVSKENVLAQRLKVDTLKWFVAKMLPKIYGDKLDVNVMNTGFREAEPEPVTVEKREDDPARVLQ